LAHADALKGRTTDSGLTNVAQPVLGALAPSARAATGLLDFSSEIRCPFTQTNILDKMNIETGKVQAEHA